MSRLRDDAAGAPRSVLHNSGAGPREVFRTPAIGRIQRFDFEAACRGWKPAVADIASRASRRAIRDAVTPAAIASLTASVLRDLAIGTPLDSGAAAADEAKRLLGVLVETLRERGSLHDLTGIAFHESRDSAYRAPGSTGVSTLALARTLAVYAVYAPPLLIWSRSPSLRWMGPGTVIALRRFDSATGPEGES
jgi:hypothetical protein